MKVLVIGATGLTGQIAVRRLLKRGDEVTALARDPAALTVRHDRLRVAKGEARDAGSLERAVQGQDAVLSAFGPRAALKKDDIQEVFMRNLVGAMERAGVKRLSNLSAWGAGDSYSALWIPGRIVLRAFLSDFFDDKNRGEAILFASSLDFVNVRPSRLVNAPARGNVKASLSPEGLRWWPLMTREDLAAFMVEQLTDDTLLRRSPLVGY
jgi:uncharacterized protein YbjT (DUF2867 family)